MPLYSRHILQGCCAYAAARAECCATSAATQTSLEMRTSEVGRLEFP